MQTDPSSVAPHLSQIWTYPIKSCAGVLNDYAVLGPRGLVYDRHWMLVTPQGRTITMRQCPQLTHVKPQIGEHHLSVTAPGMPTLELPLEASGETRQVKMWEWEAWVSAVVLEDASTWFSHHLNQKVLLVAVAPDNSRAMPPNFGSRQISFVDGNPLNVLGVASLVDLNHRLAQPVGVERFRPNLVIAGTAAYEEDGWKQVRIGSILFEVYEACQRCMVVNIDADGKQRREPLATLATYRRAGRHVLFGQNLCHMEEGVVRTGDTVRIISQQSSRDCKVVLG